MAGKLSPTQQSTNNAGLISAGRNLLAAGADRYGTKGLGDFLELKKKEDQLVADNNMKNRRMALIEAEGSRQASDAINKENDRSALQAFATSVAGSPEQKAFFTEARDMQAVYDDMAFAKDDSPSVTKEKEAKQLAFSDIADKAAPQYESRVEQATRAIDDMKKAGINITTDVLDRFNSIKAADVKSKELKSKGFEASIASDTDSLNKLLIETSKEQSKLATKGKSTKYYMTDPTGFNKKIEGLMGEVAVTEGSTDGKAITDGINLMRKKGWSDDKIAFILDSDVKYATFGDSVSNGKDAVKAYNEYGASYDKLYGSKGKEQSALNEMRRQAKGLENRISRATDGLANLSKTPKNVRDIYTASLFEDAKPNTDNDMKQLFKDVKDEKKEVIKKEVKKKTPKIKKKILDKEVIDQTKKSVFNPMFGATVQEVVSGGMIPGGTTKYRHELEPKTVVDYQQKTLDALKVRYPNKSEVELLEIMREAFKTDFSIK